MEIHIREYTPTDNQILARMFYDFSAYIRKLDLMNRIPIVEGYGEKWMKIMLEKVKKDNGKIFVAEQEKTIVGFVIGIIRHQTAEEKLETIPTITGEVLELYVDETQRGKHIGEMLLEKMETYFKQNKCDISWIGVFEPNITAREFYKKHEYKERMLYVMKQL